MIIQARGAVLPDSVAGELWIEVTSGLISDIQLGVHHQPDTIVDGILIPGFIDIHCHGGGGKYFSDSSPAAISLTISAHRNSGTTGIIASLVTETIDDLKQQVRKLLPFYNRGEILGIHLEGPYLSHAKCGAHEPSLLIEPTISQIKEILEVGQGSIKMVTIAPELIGAPAAIKYLTANKVVAAIGHTDGDESDARVATENGATVVTHFLNAMNKVGGAETMRDFIEQERRLSIELILDGHHVPISTAQEILNTFSARVVLVSDAMAAAGSIDGDYLIGKLPVAVVDGVARLKSNQKLAGSTLTLAQAFIKAVGECGLTIERAVAITSTNAARVLGLSDRGVIEVGKRADILSFNPSTLKIIRIN